MRFGGLEKCTLIDYPEKIAVMVYTIGCNFRCPYCHNPELVHETASEIKEEEILRFLSKRKAMIEGLVVTGGEPTEHVDLLGFLEKVKELGYCIKLDSNGTRPDILRAAIEKKLVDYIAMDIKGPLSSYTRIVGRPVHIGKIRESIELLKKEYVPYEFRTTIVKALLSKEDLVCIGKEISGARMYYLQQFVPTKVLNPQFLRKAVYSREELQDIQNKIYPYVTCEIR